MGLFDTILGRTKPAKPDLDALFALPSAAVTLDAGMQLKPIGVGSVCRGPRLNCGTQAYGHAEFNWAGSRMNLGGVESLR